jgi:hypothetical protein
VEEQELFTFELEYAAFYNYRYTKEIREIIYLLAYASQNVTAHIKEQLLKYKKLHDETLKTF